MKKTLLISFFAATLFACKETPKENSAQASAPAETSTVISLFDGESFAGWHSYLGGDQLNGWTIDDGAMMFDPELRTEARSSNLVSDREFTNFELVLEWKISEEGNSGIMWAVIEDEKYGQPYLTGPEIQVLDDAKHPDSFVGEGTHKAGALYDMIAPRAAVKPAMEWNHCVIRINHLTNIGTVRLNGVNVVTFPVHGPEWDEMVSKSKFANWEAFGVSRTGKIALQDHGDKVWYRNISIKEIN
jgi:hypothetical protein